MRLKLSKAIRFNDLAECRIEKGNDRSWLLLYSRVRELKLAFVLDLKEQRQFVLTLQMQQRNFECIE
jgi:hypothetical protein